MRKEWTRTEEKWLSDNYEKLGCKVCAIKLGRTENSITHKAHNLGVKRKGEGRAIRHRIFEGYIQVSDVNDRYFLHRRIMEDKIGRKLYKNEVVHHKNGDKLDNRIENLVLTTRSEHQRKHHKDDLDSRRCSKTGKFL